jgi:hypothetical protein
MSVGDVVAKIVSVCSETGGNLLRPLVPADQANQVGMLFRSIGLTNEAVTEAARENPEVAIAGLIELTGG